MTENEAFEKAFNEAGTTPETAPVKVAAEAEKQTPPAAEPEPEKAPESAPEKVPATTETVIPGETAPETGITTKADAPTTLEPAPEVKTEIPEQTRKILEALTKGGPDAEKALKDYLDHKLKDYSTMPEMDVLKEHLKVSNPTWTEKDVELEMKMKFKPIPEKIDVAEIDEYDTEAIAEAEEHNLNVDYLQNVRDREARITREALEAQKENIQLPTINDNPQAQYTEAQIAEMNQLWEAEVEAAMTHLPDVVYKIGDEEVTYKASPAEVDQFTKVMKDFNDLEYLTKRGWYDEKGNVNILKVAEDVRLLESSGKIFASMSTQVKTKVTKDIISKDIKNLDLDGTNRGTPKPGAKSFADAQLDAN